MDNRRFRRVPFSRPVRFSGRLDAEPMGAICHDLSASGIRARSSEFFAVGQIVMVGIQLVDSGAMIQVEGRVVWVRYNPYGEYYQLGIEFDRRSELPVSRIGRFIKEIK